jgi:hypothetical protein
VREAISENAGRFQRNRAQSGQENLAMPPLVVFALGVVGAAVLARWCVKEVQRVNAELDEMRAKAAVEPQDRSAMPKLKPDPKTGEYRPG